jgi:hypothetical protein
MVFSNVKLVPHQTPGAQPDSGFGSMGFPEMPVPEAGTPTEMSRTSKPDTSRPKINKLEVRLFIRFSIPTLCLLSYLID